MGFTRRRGYRRTGGQDDARRQRLVTALFDRQATRAQIKALLTGDDFLGQLGRGDRVVVYLAGHAARVNHPTQSGQPRETSFFLPHDYDDKSPVKTGIAKDELQEWLNGLAANHVLLLDDSSHGSRDWSKPARLAAKPNAPGNAPSLKPTLCSKYAAMTKPVRMGLYAAGPQEYAQENRLDKQPRGSFTYYMLAGLRSGLADLNWDGQITGEELTRFIAYKLESIGRNR